MALCGFENRLEARWMAHQVDDLDRRRLASSDAGSTLEFLDD